MLLALLLAHALPALAVPSHVIAEYQLSSHGIPIGRVTETYVRKGDTYSINSVTRSEGALKVFLDDQLTVESSGKVDAQGLKPLRFGQRRAKDAKRDIEATFDWQRGVLVTRYRGELSETPLPAATQDRLSFMYQFMNVAPGTGTLAVTMSNGRRIEQYAYRLVDEVRLETPAGAFDTRHYARVAEAGESGAEVWLAKDRFNFPVRVVFDDPKGLRLEQTLVALKSR
jgi:hypothetical protein